MEVGRRRFQWKNRGEIDIVLAFRQRLDAESGAVEHWVWHNHRSGQ
jgi:hypothetical protein